ncbi:MAG TPA: hypothetical protein VIQ03_02785 [Gammaproteobacteria bacterium]
MRKGILYSAVFGAMIASGQARAIDFDGFLSAGFAVHDMAELAYDSDANGSLDALTPATYLNSIEEDVSFDNDSKFGLQVTADVFNNMQAVAQILATGADENYDMDVEWAYLDYAITNSINLRGGKVKEPVFLISDYYEVGYAYPWIRPPEEVYNNNPINTIVGMQALFTINMGNSSIIIQPYLGSNSEAVPGTGGAVNFDATNFYGMSVQWSSAAFTLQLSSLKTDVSTVGFLTVGGPAPGTPTTPPTPGPVQVINASATGTAELSSVGFSFDVANFIGYAEYVTRDIEGSVEGLFPDQDGYYVTFGYRAGKFLPHLTVASVESEPLPLSAGANQGNTQDSVTLGLRYEVNDAAAFKFEVKSIQLDDTTASNGFFTADVPGAFYTDDKATLVSVGLDVIF